MLTRLGIITAVLAATPFVTAEAQNCKKGIRCGNTCIAANKTCRIGSTSSSSGTTAGGDAAAAAVAALTPTGTFDPFKLPNLGADDSLSVHWSRGLRCTDADAVGYQSCAMLVYPIAGMNAEVYYGLMDGQAFRFRMRFRSDRYTEIVAAIMEKIGRPETGNGRDAPVHTWPFPVGTLVVRKDDGTRARWGDAVLDRRK
jgi:hypothetical protein